MSQRASGQLDGLRVLVVDDEPDLRLGLEKLVSSLGATVSTADSGDAAARALSKSAADIVISDIRMPGMNGIELLDHIRSNHPTTRVILVTGFGSIELAVQSVKAGAEHFITKPFDNHELLAAVRAVGNKILSDAMSSEVQQDCSSRLVFGPGPMKDAMDVVQQVAGTVLPVLIEGETGTGKELVAQEVHSLSGLSQKPFCAVNCAALPDALLESELFGHVKGAFTGATNDRDGLFVEADGGTVFLDEVASMSLAFQGKLLRVLQNKVVRPLGSDRDRTVEFRLLAASNQKLDEMVEKGTFRRDLLHRLRVLSLTLPPLRDRPGDIVLLSRYFVSRYSGECHNGDVPELSTDVLDRLATAAWPGNVRELENVILRALVAASGNPIDVSHLGLPEPTDSGRTNQDYEAAKQTAIRRFQAQYIQAALRRAEGNVSHAANQCGMTRAALQRIMRTLQIERTDFLP